jgi:membrane-associated protein
LEHLISFWNVIMHLDVHLTAWANTMGPWLYVALFAVLFCETGLVVTPFLPGDSLLFAIGSLCAQDGSPLTLGVTIPLLIVAAILGDAVNYSVGRFIGPKVFKSEGSLLFNKSHLVKTQAFYEKYGSKTIIIARFVPIVRTFAPFVAGVGSMRYRRFFAYNVIGAVLWVVLLLPLGYVFANAPFVKKNFSIVIFAIIGISILPAVIEILRARSKKAEPAVAASESMAQPGEAD